MDIWSAGLGLDYTSSCGAHLGNKIIEATQHEHYDYYECRLALYFANALSIMKCSANYKIWCRHTNWRIPYCIQAGATQCLKATYKDDTVGKEEGNRHNIRKQKLSFKTDWLQKYAKHIFDNNPKSEKDKVEYLECFGTEW